VGDIETRIGKIETRFEDHTKEAGQRNIDFYQKLSEFESFMKTFPDIVAMKIAEKIDEKYVQKCDIEAILNKERIKSGKIYVQISEAAHVWNDLYEKRSTKDLDTFSKKVKMWGFFGSIGLTILTYIVTMAIKTSVLLTQMVHAIGF
jgi:hypothetical protein